MRDFIIDESARSADKKNWLMLRLQNGSSSTAIEKEQKKLSIMTYKNDDFCHLFLSNIYTKLITVIVLIDFCKQFVLFIYILPNNNT